MTDAAAYYPINARDADVPFLSQNDHESLLQSHRSFPPPLIESSRGFIESSRGLIDRLPGRLDEPASPTEDAGCAKCTCFLLGCNVGGLLVIAVFIGLFFMFKDIVCPANRTL